VPIILRPLGPVRVNWAIQQAMLSSLSTSSCHATFKIRAPPQSCLLPTTTKSYILRSFPQAHPNFSLKPLQLSIPINFFEQSSNPTAKMKSVMIAAGVFAISAVAQIESLPSCGVSSPLRTSIFAEAPQRGTTRRIRSQWL